MKPSPFGFDPETFFVKTGSTPTGAGTVGGVEALGESTTQAHPKSYLMISDDGGILHFKSLTSDDTDAAEDGEVTLLDVSIPESPKYYSDGIWRPVPSPEEEDL